jgi:pyruvate dehydrogenase E2 component (dihydrolipoamide acetyltransferase)
MSLELTPVEQTPMRRAVARRMSDSKRDAPHFYVTIEAVVDGPVAAVESERAKGRRVTLTAFLVMATAAALVEHPAFNAVWTEEGPARAASVNIGVAVALDDGLVAPALLGAETLDLVATAAALDDLVARARAGKLRSSELTEATFTISNLGMYGVRSFSAIVTPPQVAILAAGSVQRRPRYEGDSLVARDVIELTLSADHRAVDGAEAAMFLRTLVRGLEQPS